MSSRGARAKNGHVTDSEYKIVKTIGEAKVLEGAGNNHGLPDYAHSPNAIYIKEDHEGNFREMRVYDENGNPLYEIGYHGEKSLTGDRNTKVLHYHLFGENLERSKASNDAYLDTLKEKHREILEEYNL